MVEMRAAAARYTPTGTAVPDAGATSILLLLGVGAVVGLNFLLHGRTES